MDFKHFLPYLFKVSYLDSGNEELEDLASKILAQRSCVVMPSIKADISWVHLRKQVQGFVFSLFKVTRLFGSFEQTQ